MARRKESTSLEERMTIAQQAEAGQTDREIATQMDLFLWTVRKWRHKAQKEGQASLSPCRGRSLTGIVGAFPSEVRPLLRRMRETHPGWGPVTLRLELENWGYTGPRLPSRSRIAAFLHQEGLTRPYRRRSDLPQPGPARAQQVREEWAVDAQRVVQTPLGAISVINIVDEVSHLIGASLLRPGISHPGREDYQLGLRLAFLRYGLPERITLDHDTVFYDNISTSPFPTLIHLWAIALGIEVRFIEHPPPREHSRIERTHQTVNRQAVEGQKPADATAFQRELDRRREFLNRRYSAAALGGKPPLEAFPEARHSGRPYRLEWEEEMLDMQRVAAYLAQGRWFRRVSAQGQFGLGGHTYTLVGRHSPRQEVEITFAPRAGGWSVGRRRGAGSPRADPGVDQSRPDGRAESSGLGARLPALAALSPAAWREMVLAEARRGTIF